MIHIFRLYKLTLTGRSLLQKPIHLILRRPLAQSTRHYASRLKLKKPDAASPPPPTTSQQRAKLAKAVPETAPAQGTLTGTFEYPAALRIYSRSARRIAFLGIIRLAPFILISIWIIQIGSMVLDSPETLHWPIVLQAGASLLPILLVTPLTSGYVARIIVQLPPHARRNKEALQKWMQSIPSDTLLEIKTVRANGFSWATDQCLVRDLRTKKPTWLSKGNFVRLVDPAVDQRRHASFWKSLYAMIADPPRNLQIATNEGLKNKVVKDSRIWPLIEEQIKKRSSEAS